jgi:hypothetical protein
MKDVFGHSRTSQQWTVQVTYPRAMRPRHTDTFCTWWTKTGATLGSVRSGTDTKDGDGEVLIELFLFDGFEQAKSFCSYTCSQFDKWSGPGSEGRYTVKLRGQVKFKDKTEGRVGENHPARKKEEGKSDEPR